MADEMTANLMENGSAADTQPGSERKREGEEVRTASHSRTAPARYLGLDFGAKTVGVAVSDALGLTAQGLETIRRERENKLRQTLARIEELAQEYQVSAIVLGFPKNLDNTEGIRAQKTLEFKEMLEKRTGLEVILWDERLTTNAADRTLEEAGIRKENRKLYLDRIAAVFILQGYLDRLGVSV